MKPILFNTEMVRAILDGRKSCTRRVMKPQPDKCGGAPLCCGPVEICRDSETGDWYCAHCGNIFTQMKLPYHPGDILWVRETWTYLGTDRENNPCFAYKANSPHLQNNMYIKWRPSIHMPREAARLLLRVTDVRVERLREIDGRGVLAEGVGNGKSNPKMGIRWENMQRMAFANLWDSTIKPTDLPLYGWSANPWVWVIEFARISREEAEDTDDT